MKHKKVYEIINKLCILNDIYLIIYKESLLLDNHFNLCACAGRLENEPIIWIGLYQNPKLLLFSFLHLLGHLSRYGLKTSLLYSSLINAWQYAINKIHKYCKYNRQMKKYMNKCLNKYLNSLYVSNDSKFRRFKK